MLAYERFLEIITREDTEGFIVEVAHLNFNPAYFQKELEGYYQCWSFIECLLCTKL